MNVIEIGSDEDARYMLLNREVDSVIPAMEYLKYPFKIIELHKQLFFSIELNSAAFLLEGCSNF